MLKLRVSTMETEFDMKIKASATGKDVFEAVKTAIGIRETWFFGLSYVDCFDQPAWMLDHKPIRKQNLRREDPVDLQFKFKYFPVSVDEVIQDITLRLLFKQVRRDILDGEIFCPAEKAVLLASFWAQSKFGDFGVGEVVEGYLIKEKFIPPKVLQQHSLSTKEWEAKVIEFHKRHKGIYHTDAMREYLKTAADLETFGVTYYPVSNKKGTEVLLGVSALGINLYHVTDRLNPKIAFPWSEILKVSASGSEFKVKFSAVSTAPFVAKAKDGRACQKIFDLVTGNHEKHKRRQLPDPLDVQQMKVEKKAEREQREREREAMRRRVREEMGTGTGKEEEGGATQAVSPPLQQSRDGGDQPPSYDDVVDGAAGGTS